MTSVTTKPDSSQPAAETAVYLFDNCRHLKLHPAEASQQRPRPMAVAVTGGTDRPLGFAVPRFRMASAARSGSRIHPCHD